jgi:2-polyprenyl-3-methyl-5-hydroxy-6-metoxy-1,4-benzoquinol methylase
MKIEDIRPKNQTTSQREAYLRDVDTYREKQEQFISRGCPGCLSSNNNFFAFHLGFTFVKCSSCFSIYMNPGPTNEMVQEFYENSSNYSYWSREIYPKTRESRRATIHRDRAFFVENARERFSKLNVFQKVLEIGSGTGDTLSVLRETTKDSILTYAVEPNKSMQGALQENKVTVVGSLLEINNLTFDVIMAFEVIEHFLSPDDFFDLYCPLLVQDGLIVLSTPNAHSLEVQLLKDKSSTIDIEHISVLTPAAIHSLASRHGLKVEAISTPGEFDLELLNTESIDIKIQDNQQLLDDSQLQGLVSELGFSSHMKVILSKI